MSTMLSIIFLVIVIAVILTIGLAFVRKFWKIFKFIIPTGIIAMALNEFGVNYESSIAYAIVMILVIMILRQIHAKNNDKIEK